MLRHAEKKAINIVYCLFCFLALCFGEQITHYNEKNVKLSLLPANSVLSQTAPDFWNSEKGKEPVFIAETTLEFPKVDGAMEKVTRIMQSFSSMQGITYYSNLKKKQEVLYPKCYTVGGPSSKTPVPDGTSTYLDGKTNYFYQEDQTLGSSVYQVTYVQKENEIRLQMKNLQALSYGFIKLVKPESLYMTLVVSEQYDTINLYILVQVDVVSMSLIEDYITQSFNSRLEAISAWFRTEYEK